jgi:hypothetical protein
LGLEKKTTTHLHSCFERQEGIPGIAHLKYSPEAVFGQVANLENLQVGRHGAEVELGHDDIIDNDRRLRRLVQGRRQEITGSLVEFRIGRQRRPVEVEGHVELAPVLKTHRSQENLGSDKPGVVGGCAGCGDDDSAMRFSKSVAVVVSGAKVCVAMDVCTGSSVLFRAEVGVEG